MARENRKKYLLNRSAFSWSLEVETEPNCIIGASDLWLVTLLMYRNIAERLELCLETRLDSNTTFADDI